MSATIDLTGNALRQLQQYSGGQADLTPWPRPGVRVSLSDKVTIDRPASGPLSAGETATITGVVVAYGHTADGQAVLTAVFPALIQPDPANDCWPR